VGKYCTKLSHWTLLPAYSTLIREQMDVKWCFVWCIKSLDLFLNLFFIPCPNFLMVLCNANYSNIVTLWVTVEIFRKLSVCICSSSILILLSSVSDTISSFPTIYIYIYIYIYTCVFLCALKKIIVGLELRDNSSSGKYLATPQIQAVVKVQLRRLSESLSQIALPVRLEIRTLFASTGTKGVHSWGTSDLHFTIYLQNRPPVNVFNHCHQASLCVRCLSTVSRASVTALNVKSTALLLVSIWHVRVVHWNKGSYVISMWKLNRQFWNKF
jgi:hypothetical protein